MANKPRNFREYAIWQDAVVLAKEVYAATEKMPWFEKKGLCDQLQRAVVSISSNIAEGAGHPTDRDFAHYLDMALGSAYEVETQLIIANGVGYLSEDVFNVFMEKLQKLEKQITYLIGRIRNEATE